MYTTGAALESSEGMGFPGAGVAGGCRLPAAGAGSGHGCPLATCLKASPIFHLLLNSHTSLFFKVRVI